MEKFEKMKVVDVQDEMKIVHEGGLDDDMHEGVLEVLKETQEAYNRLLESIQTKPY
jgi:hypothetical protein